MGPAQAYYFACVVFFQTKSPYLKYNLDFKKVEKVFKLARRRKKISAILSQSKVEKIIFFIFCYFVSVSKPNPLDQFFDSSNFEILDSSSSNADKSNDGNFGGNRVFEIEIIGPYQLVNLFPSQLNNFDLIIRKKTIKNN